LDTYESFKSQLYGVNDLTFTNIALELFSFQAKSNPVYKSFLKHLGWENRTPQTLSEIPFMPISFFKRHTVKTGAWTTEQIFESSGTTGVATSSHHVRDPGFYRQHCQKGFEQFFGKVTDYHFLALLPSYLERANSSLVSMMDHFIKASASPVSGFYLDNTDKLLSDLRTLKNGDRKPILFGVTFALLDLAEKHPSDLSHCLVFETGGMKGRRQEMIRAELHDRLKEGLGVRQVYSEYGMTELFSQAYLMDSDIFSPPPWMKVVGRDITDPFKKGLLRETAGINVIDLGNLHSSAFIETEDLGRVYENGTFEISGRIDNSDVRGCNLLIH
jgi:phenylacetate-coenzyme A ligase PaaK-like adenylate-forming protein